MTDDEGDADGAPPRGAGNSGEPRIVDVNVLLAGQREVIIAHQGERYRLRLTQNGKLILTK